MTRLIFFLFGPFLLLGCTQKSKINNFSSHFNQAEIRDIQKITTFFKEQMCGPNNGFETCIDSLNLFLIENGWQAIFENIDFEKQKELYNSLESKLFDEIWSFCKSSNPKIDWERKSICLNSFGKYLTFLKLISVGNPILGAYTEELQRAGDFVSISIIESEINFKSQMID